MGKANAGVLEQIEHVVVLMLENRSFDNILGHLYDAERGSNALLLPSGEEETIAAWCTTGTTYPKMTIPAPDPGEAFQDMNQQIFGLEQRAAAGPPYPTEPGKLGWMGGFAQNYQVILEGGEDNNPKNQSDTPVRAIMNYFSAEQVPISTLLAKTFTPVLSYHASAPCQTLPNRTFAQLGTANGFVNNSSQEGIPHAPYFGTSIFGQFRAAQKHKPELDWRCYFGDLPLTLAMVDTWEQFDREHFRPLETFFEDAKKGSLPSYTWLEPAYQISPNDNHPPHDVTRGEALLATVYNALRSSPLWSKTLFILTYDEHGGCFDSVKPDVAVPPGEPYPDGFNFDRYGVRVPCILISDYTLATLQSNEAENAAPNKTYDHTSILAMLRQRWPELGNALSAREAAANPLSDFLNPARSGAPEQVPVPTPLSSIVALEQQAITDAKELLAAKAAGASASELKTMFDNNLKTLAEQALADELSPYISRLLEDLSEHIPRDDLLGWLASGLAKILRLAHNLIEAHQPVHALHVNELGQLSGWIGEFFATHHEAHLRGELSEAYCEDAKRQQTSLEGLDKLHVHAAIRRVQKLLEAR